MTVPIALSFAVAALVPVVVLIHSMITVAPPVCSPIGLRLSPFVFRVIPIYTSVDRNVGAAAITIELVALVLV